MMDGRCKTCKWWANCGGPIMRVCNHQRVGGAVANDVTDAAEDTSGRGAIFTGPNFSCIHYEPATPKDRHEENDGA